MNVSLIVSFDTIKDEATLRHNIIDFKINNFHFRKDGRSKC